MLASSPNTTPPRVEFQGANHLPDIAGVGEMKGKDNYLKGNDLSKWHTTEVSNRADFEEHVRYVVSCVRRVDFEVWDFVQQGDSIAVGGSWVDNVTLKLFVQTITTKLSLLAGKSSKRL